MKTHNFKLILCLTFLGCRILYGYDTKEAEEPKLVFKNNTVDFGNVFSNTVTSKEVAFRNDGQKPLKINNIKASCGCMTGKLEQKVLQTGESATIKLIFDSSDRYGGYKGNLLITSNDPTLPNAVIEITANILEMITTTPRTLFFSDMEIGQTKTQSLRVKSEIPLTIEVASSLTQGQDADILIHPASQRISSETSEFKVSVTPHSIGRFTKQILFKSKDTKDSLVVNVPVAVSVQGSILAKPEVLWFTKTSAKKEKIVELTKRNRGDLHLDVNSIAYDPNIVDITLHQNEKQCVANLHVTPLKDAFSSARTIKSTIVISVVDGRVASKITIPIMLIRDFTQNDNEAPNIATVTGEVEVGNNGITLIKYDRNRGKFNSGWIAPPNGELELNEFSVGIQAKQLKVIPIDPAYAQAFILKSNNPTLYRKTLGSKHDSTEQISNHKDDVLFVILQSTSEPNELLQNMWKEFLSYNKAVTVFIMPGKIDIPEFRDISYAFDSRVDRTPSSSSLTILASEFPVTTEGITLLRFNERKHSFNAGSIAPPSGEIELADFSLKIKEDKCIITALHGNYSKGLLVEAKEVSSSIINNNASIKEWLTSIKAKSLDQNLLFIILDSKMSQPLMKQLWQQLLLQDKNETILIVQSKVDSNLFKQIAFEIRGDL